MSDFKVGDKVVIVNNFDDWSDNGLFPVTSVLTVVDDNEHTFGYIDNEALTVELQGINHSKGDFKLVEAPFGGFVSANTTYILGETVSEATAPLRFGSCHLGATVNFTNDPIPELGVYRPNLQDRKVGKVPMHMVTDGFPHALQHIAEIMGWAADTKGYKLHDWKNLPNADIELPSAADRHGNDNSKQKSTGLSALERVDHESSKLHIGHKVFNLLAELELVLTGKIK